MTRNKAACVFAEIRKIYLILIPFVLFSCDRKISPQFQTSLGTVCFVNLYDDGKKSIYDEISKRLNEIDGEFNVNKENSEFTRHYVPAPGPALILSCVS